MTLMSLTKTGAGRGKEVCLISQSSWSWWIESKYFYLRTKTQGYFCHRISQKSQISLKPSKWNLLFQSDPSNLITKCSAPISTVSLFSPKCDRSVKCCCLNHILCVIYLSLQLALFKYNSNNHSISKVSFQGLFWLIRKSFCTPTQNKTKKGHTHILFSDLFLSHI